MADVIFLVGIFLVSFLAGYVLISRVPALLHTPLMSMTNAISAVVILGGVVMLATVRTQHELILALAAILTTSFNIVGDFIITDQMLKIFKKQPIASPLAKPEIEK